MKADSIPISGSFDHTVSKWWYHAGSFFTRVGDDIAWWWRVDIMGTSWGIYAFIGGCILLILLCAGCCTCCCRYRKRKKLEKEEKEKGESAHLDDPLLESTDVEEGHKEEPKSSILGTFSISKREDSDKQKEAAVSQQTEVQKKDKAEALKKRREQRKQKKQMKRVETELVEEKPEYNIGTPGKGRLGEADSFHIAAVDVEEGEDKEAQDEDMRSILASFIEILQSGIKLKMFKPQKNSSSDGVLRLQGHDICWTRSSGKTGRCKKMKQVAIAELLEAKVYLADELPEEYKNFTFELKVAEDRLQPILIANDQELRDRLIQGFTYLITAHQNKSIDAFLSRHSAADSKKVSTSPMSALKRPMPTPKKY